MSRGSFAVAEKLPVAKIAIIRRPIAPAFAHDDEAFAKIDELLDLEPPTRRSHDLTRELAAASARMEDAFEEEKPTLMVTAHENLRLLAAAFGEAEKNTDDEVTLDAPSPLIALANGPRVASFVGDAAPPRSGVQLKKPDSQTLLVAGIWAAAVSAMGVLAFFLTGA